MMGYAITQWEPQDHWSRNGMKQIINISMILVLMINGFLWDVRKVEAQISQMQADEYEVKAAFLYNFTKFVEWPAKVFPSDDSPFVIAILGDDPFGNVIDRTVQNYSFNGRRIEIKRSYQVEDVKTCQVVFISTSEQDSIEHIMHVLKGLSILTVSDMDVFINNGGMIRFIHDKNRIRFQIDPDAAQSAGLKMSSQLLQLAQIIRPSNGGDR